MRSNLLRYGERGSGTVLEMIFVVGVLLLPTLMGLAQVLRWIDARSTAELAAQEAVRQAVLADDAASGAAAGEAMARQIVANHGWPADALVSITIAGDLVAGQEVEATVTMEFPAIAFPVGSFGGGTVTRSHSERVEDYREF